MNIVGLVPARGGSERIKNKNMRIVGGRTLLARAVDTLHAGGLETVYVSTDSSLIAAEAESCGAEVIARPDHLADGAGRMEQKVIAPFIQALRDRGELPDAIILLQCTSPLFPASGVICMRKELRDHASTVALFEDTKSYFAGEVDDLGVFRPDHPERINTQLLPPRGNQAGAWGFTIPEFELSGDRMGISPFAVFVPRQIDIDTEDDLTEANRCCDIGSLFVLLRNTSTASDTEKKLADVELIFLDCDGVLTTNNVYVDSMGDEVLSFNRSDGHGIAMMKRAGIEVCVVTSGDCGAAKARCKKLRIPYHVSSDKEHFCEWFAKGRKFAFVGNDVMDIDAMKSAHVAVAVGDAYEEVIDVADLELICSGGYGAVREMCDLILKARGGQDDSRTRGSEWAVRWDSTRGFVPTKY